MNEAQQNPETHQKPSTPGKSTITRRTILKAGWVAPVVLAVPLMGAGKAGRVPPHGSGYTPGSKDYGKGSKDFGKGSKDFGKGSKDFGKGGNNNGNKGKNNPNNKGGKWWASWIKWD